MNIGRINHIKQNLGFGKLVSLKDAPPSNEPVCQLETDRIVKAEPILNQTHTKIFLDRLENTAIDKGFTRYNYQQMELNIPYANYLKQIEEQTK